MTEDKEKKTIKDYFVEIKANKRTKRCSKCKKTYPATPKYFYKHKVAKYGLNSMCIECKRKEDKLRYLTKKYGISVKTFKEMLREQKNSCAICGRQFADIYEVKRYHKFGFSPNVDHNHKTGEVRGLVCNTCNRMIGFGLENPFILINTVKYLKKRLFFK